MEKLGNFKYEIDVKDDVKRILKDLQTIEGGGSYYGFWYSYQDKVV
jgi:hypothetical protein